MFLTFFWAVFSGKSNERKPHKKSPEKWEKKSEEHRKNLHSGHYELKLLAIIVGTCPLLSQFGTFELKDSSNEIKVMLRGSLYFRIFTKTFQLWKSCRRKVFKKIYGVSKGLIFVIESF